MLNMSAKSRRINRSTVPSGTLVLSDRLQGSELHLALKSKKSSTHAQLHQPHPFACAGKVKVHVEGGLGYVDARPSASIACIYLTGEEVKGQVSSDTRARMTALAKVLVSFPVPQSHVLGCCLSLECREWYWWSVEGWRQRVSLTYRR